MIDINLVPPQFKKKRKRALPDASKGLPKEAVIAVVGFLIVVLVVSAGLLQFFIYSKLAQRTRLKNELAELVPQKINTERYVGQLKDINARLAPLEKILGAKDIVWSQKLNEISDTLPRGVWLTKIQLADGTLLLHGSAVSKTQTEMISVHTFNAKLKESQAFMRDFSDEELEFIKSRALNGTPVADFTIRVDL